MAKKKKPASSETLGESMPASSSSGSLPDPAASSSLVICRNKHWKYISCFHGPWLQLPPEMLESLAHNNYVSPRPHPIDPAVFYDIVKIRKAMDEATNLAVRATSGLTSAALSSSMNAGNGMLGSAGVAALGLGYGNAGTSKLSRERKFRMRELATQKLSAAYQLDEIATSVATMQSTSTLEDVAQFVLQRNPADSDAKYVHFFHEKIPSRMMAQCTPLDPLNEIIADQPTSASIYRTRALTRLFKEDFIGAAKDLTEGLAACKYAMTQHREGKDQVVLASKVRDEAEKKNARDWRHEIKIEEEDQPSSLEAQMLFHRAGAYFTIACQHINEAIDAFTQVKLFKQRREQPKVSMGGSVNGIAASPAIEEDYAEPPELSEPSAAEKEAHRKHLEARKLVKANAKRALRDYTSFISHFDYTPPLPLPVAEEFLRRVNNAANGSSEDANYGGNRRQQFLDSATSSTLSNGLSNALVPHHTSFTNSTQTNTNGWPVLPPPEVFPLSTLFAATPPSGLPPFQANVMDLVIGSSGNRTNPPALQSAAAFASNHEVITYHPLLTDALHSILLVHALLQTSPKELLRHANNVARLVRVCDGYPIFLAARSPARADWIEIVRRTGDWIGLSQSWETLCRPSPLPGQRDDVERKRETPEQRRERLKHEAILEALADERVVDEESFQRAVRARERRAMEDEIMAEQQGNGSRSSSNGTSPSTPKSGPKRWAQDDREYPISTERAEAITKWIKDAPLTVEGSKKRRPPKGKGKSRKDEPEAAPQLESGLSGLSVTDIPEEEIDE